MIKIVLLAIFVTVNGSALFGQHSDQLSLEQLVVMNDDEIDDVFLQRAFDPFVSWLKSSESRRIDIVEHVISRRANQDAALSTRFVRQILCEKEKSFYFTRLHEQELAIDPTPHSQEPQKAKQYYGSAMLVTGDNAFFREYKSGKNWIPLTESICAKKTMFRDYRLAPISSASTMFFSMGKSLGSKTILDRKPSQVIIYVDESFDAIWTSEKTNIATSIHFSSERGRMPTTLSLSSFKTAETGDIEQENTPAVFAQTTSKWRDLGDQKWELERVSMHYRTPFSSPGAGSVVNLELKLKISGEKVKSDVFRPTLDNFEVPDVR